MQWTPRIAGQDGTLDSVTAEGRLVGAAPMGRCGRCSPGATADSSELVQSVEIHWGDGHDTAAAADGALALGAGAKLPQLTRGHWDCYRWVGEEAEGLPWSCPAQPGACVTGSVLAAGWEGK